MTINDTWIQTTYLCSHSSKLIYIYFKLWNNFFLIFYSINIQLSHTYTHIQNIVRFQSAKNFIPCLQPCKHCENVICSVQCIYTHTPHGILHLRSCGAWVDTFALCGLTLSAVMNILKIINNVTAILHKVRNLRIFKIFISYIRHFHIIKIYKEYC